MAGNEGLRDVVAAQSSITSIDGMAGELRYRGYPIEELAENCTFEQVAYLLWHGELPDDAQLHSLESELDRFRQERVDLLDGLDSIPAKAHPLDVLRYYVSRDALSNPLTADNDEATNFRKAAQFTAWFPMVVAGLHRVRHGQQPVPPPRDADTATAFLSMLWGREPDEVAIRTLTTSLILHADHELNASTFAARVTIATQSNLHAAIASAVGTLAGPLNGGASDRVIRMVEAIGTPDRAEPWVREQFANHERIMGFGHAVYRTTDPRARILRGMAERLLTGTPHEQWVAILDAVGEVVREEKNLYPNVDLFAAIVNHELGIDPAFYSSIFACSRIVGWTAHAIEQLGGRLIRPSAEYVGPQPRHLPSPVA